MIESVRLSILVPSSPPVIYDDHDIPLSEVVGPFHLGSNITLKCVSRGGNPLPILVWTKNDLTLNTTFKVRLGLFITVSCCETLQMGLCGQLFI